MYFLFHTVSDIVVRTCDNPFFASDDCQFWPRLSLVVHPAVLGSSGLLNPCRSAAQFYPLRKAHEWPWKSTWVTWEWQLILGLHMKCAYHLNIYILRTYPFFSWPKLVESNKSLFLLAKTIVFPGNKAPIPKSIVCGSSLLSVSWSIFKNPPISQKYTLYPIHINHKKNTFDRIEILSYSIPILIGEIPIRTKNMLEK